MKTHRNSLIVMMAAVLALSLSVACNRGASDAQIAGEVQNKISTDQGIQSRQITVQSANGVVTLNGTVNNDTERAAAANDAAQIAGVKTVVNNLQVAAPQQAQAEEPAPAPERTPEPARRARRPAPRHRAAEAATPARDYTQTVAPAPATTAENIAPAPAPAPAPPPPPRKVEVPAGTSFAVRLIDGLDSERNQVGDTFRASLSQPLYVGDEVVIPQGADVEGRVVDVKSAGHFAGQSVLTLELTSLNVNGHRYGLQTDQWSKQGTSRGKRTAATVGGGAALGAIIGGIAGGGKGAAIGSVIGAGAGTGVQGATKGQQIQLPSETVLNFQLQGPVSVIPQSEMRRGAASDQSVPDYSDGRPELRRRTTPSDPHQDDEQPPVLMRRPR